MAKMKVHELAKELEIQSKDVIAFLQEKGIEVKAAQSSVEEEHVAMVKGHFGKGEVKEETEPKAVKEPEAEIPAAKAEAPAAKAEAPKKKKTIIFVSNPQNSKMPGSKPMPNQNKKPAQPQQAPAKQAPVKQIQLGPNQMINKATGKIMEKLPPKQEVKEEVAAPVKEGYTFKGWYTDNTFTNKITSIKKGSRENINVYVKWQVNNYNIKFSANGGKGKIDTLKNCEYDKAYTLPENTFTRNGYIFNGWNTKKDGTGESFKDVQEIKNLTAKNKATITLYAQWINN